MSCGGRESSLSVKNKKRKAKKIALFVLGALLFLTAYIYASTHSIAVKQYILPVENLPSSFEGFTILHLTDLHSKQFGENQENLLEVINEQQFDIVALTGDLVDRHKPDPGAAAELLEGLKPYEIYFVPGNHEHWTDYDKLKEILLAYDVVILENKADRYSSGDSHLWLLGVDDPSLGLARLDKAIDAVTDDLPLILLAHSPNIYHDAVKENIDIVLAGHTHGGQVRVPFLGAIYVPGQGFFPEYDYGIFSSDNTTMVINAGLGESVIPFRFNIRPELVLITLESL